MPKKRPEFDLIFTDVIPLNHECDEAHTHYRQLINKLNADLTSYQSTNKSQKCVPNRDTDDCSECQGTGEGRHEGECCGSCGGIGINLPH